ncbi:MAG: hypothetical protein ABS97_20915 [Lysobacteraceae bacterium SCN 69-320]|nr:MAG: hypothetical protein ABS97_20915 [Xanthomonadaceae bacterium SCN 69-320]
MHRGRPASAAPPASQDGVGAWRDELVRALRGLRLKATADAVEALRADGGGPLADGLGELVAALQHGSDTRALERRFRDARLPVPGAALEDAWTGLVRGLPPAVVAQLADGAWATRHESVLVTSECGGGKTWLSCALAAAVLRAGGTAAWFHQADFLAAWASADAAGTLGALRRRLASATVLVLEELGVEPLEDGDLAVLRRLVEPRPGGFILTSPFPPALWPEHWCGKTMSSADAYTTEAVLRRLVNPSHRIELRGKAAEFKPGSEAPPPVPRSSLSPPKAKRLPPSKRKAQAAGKAGRARA